MIKTLSNSFWFFIAIGVFGLVLDPQGSNLFFSRLYSAFLKLYLLGISAFLVFKLLHTYRIKQNAQLIRLRRKSEHQNILIWQGIVLFLIFLVYQRFYHTILSGDTVLLFLLLFYYFVQIYLHSSPTFYIDEQDIHYDDYFLARIPWKEIEDLSIQDGQLRIRSARKEMVLDLNNIDQSDQEKIKIEIDFSVLDGAIASDRSSRSILEVLREFAKINGMEIRGQA